VIDVVDTRAAKITATRKLGEISGVVTGLRLSGDGDRAYLVTDDGVTVLSTLSDDVVGTLAVTNQPSCVVESADARYLYVADYSGKVTVAPVAAIVTLGIENQPASA
jgi:DNA-binding beta-propeller fold protein YncE